MDPDFGRTTLLRDVDLLHYLLPGMVAAGLTYSMRDLLKRGWYFPIACVCSVGLVPLLIALECLTVGAETRGELGRWMFQSAVVGGLPSLLCGVSFALVADLQKSDRWYLRSDNWVAAIYGVILAYLLWRWVVGYGTL
jgi:hypothetical protein